MKCIYLLCLALISFVFSFASPKIHQSSFYGVWSTASSWDLNRIPANGDTIIIPSTDTLVISNDLNLSNVHLRIYGLLKIINLNTQINLDNQSDIVIYAAGMIKGSLASQKIRIANFNIYQGNTAAVAGPTFANASSGGFQYSVLPVKFLGFNVARKNNDATIQWSTSEEINASGYEVERSFDANNWSKIAYMVASKSSNINNYSYTDKNAVTKPVYYRIKQVDVDGKFTYTAIKSITVDYNSQVSVAAIQNKVVLQFPQEIKTGVFVRIVSLGGQVISEQRIEQAFGQIILRTNVKGNYIVSVSNGNDVNVARQVII